MHCLRRIIPHIFIEWQTSKVADERTVDMPSSAATKSTRRVPQRHVEKKLDKTDREEPA